MPAEARGAGARPLHGAARRVRRSLRRARDLFPLTGLGTLILAFSAIALAVGAGEVDLVLLGAGAIGATAVFLSLATVGLATLRVRAALGRMTRTEAPLVVECGWPVRTGYALPRLRWIPGARVRWKWIAPSAKMRIVAVSGWLEEEVVPTSRAWSERLQRRIEIGDAFGLAAITLDREERRPVRILPSVGGLKQMHVVRTLSGGGDFSHPEGSPDGERLDLRSYAPGDPIKYVLWTVFARTRQLVIRTPERALSAARKTLAYLVAGAGDEPAAGAARVAVDMGALGGEWAFGADGVDEPATTKDAALEALARSADTPRDKGGRGLAHFMRQTASTNAARAVVFVPGKPGPWLEGLVQSAQQIPADGMGRLPLEFVVCTDGVKGKRGKSRVAFALDPKEGEAASDAPVAADELSRVVATLGRLRARVIVVDRRDGHVHVAAG